MGIVWLAHDDELDREVALKFLPEIIVHDRGVVEDLKRETKRCLQLTHKNIIRIHDFIQDNISACISMEYIDGDTLSNLRADKATRIFEPDEIRPWLSQLCEALDYAHNHARIIHRDLKPSNLMISKRGQLKIADFGIARSLTESVSMLTHSHSASGTLVYMSPQQLDGQRGTHLDDIYSLGATLYELLTSKPPFYSGDIPQQIRERIPPSMAERRRDFDIEGNPVPKNWEKAVAACLAKEPAKRPQSVTEVEHRLLSAQAAQTLPVVRPPPVTKPRAKSRRTTVVASAIAILAAAGGLLFGWYQHQRQLTAQKIAKADRSTITTATPQSATAAPTPLAPLPGKLGDTEQSPKGDIRVEYRRTDTPEHLELEGAIWLISNVNKTNRVLLYKYGRSAQLIFSPNEDRLVINDDHSSGESTVQLFRRVRSDDIAYEVPPEVAGHRRPLGILAWCFYSKEMGGTGSDCDIGDPYHVFIHAMAWRSDSSAVMIKIGHGGSGSLYAPTTPYECWYEVENRHFKSITYVDGLKQEIEEARAHQSSPAQNVAITATPAIQPGSPSQTLSAREPQTELQTESTDHTGTIPADVTWPRVYGITFAGKPGYGVATKSESIINGVVTTGSGKHSRSMWRSDWGQGSYIESQVNGDMINVDNAKKTYMITTLLDLKNAQAQTEKLKKQYPSAFPKQSVAASSKRTEFTPTGRTVEVGGHKLEEFVSEYSVAGTAMRSEVWISRELVAFVPVEYAHRHPSVSHYLGEYGPDRLKLPGFATFSKESSNGYGSQWKLLSIGMEQMNDSDFKPPAGYRQIKSGVQ